MTAPLPSPPPREPDLVDDFVSGPDPDLWIASYLEHWTTPDRAAARWSTSPDGLILRIDADQPDWRPEDAPLRVSNLQTGSFSGPVGSTRGIHRHRPDGLGVRTPVPTRLLWTPRAGRVDITLSASRDPGCMVAAWLVGTEHEDPRDCGEVCLAEIDSRPDTSGWAARLGVKAHGDDRLTTDMSEIALDIDASDRHTWTAVWGEGETILGLDGVELRRIPQAPDYPMVLMVDLFEVGAPGGSYPKTAVVHSVRGWGDEPDLTPRG
ncbi:hypothetical protein NY547_08075 [Cnuibacter physcomitrellae]|uniref:hypothetical protein n=1 Tax=Cnuibacter physcomitrellae TaxID=1619308 RepID=UPI0021757934|nr:hypothetical protein [Cnuibacter physcomitrellae]MCS5497189.1 hypothetical protein [Cnuibacter physcomitrellae]